MEFFDRETAMLLCFKRLQRGLGECETLVLRVH
jgi:hypothetical protein